ncbi:MAG: DEAD/DEAH box helicase family protein [Bacteroidales bacterium]|nr:DEAD/DEAH box helicase family protein [Bacteroidales bacterium]
MNIQLLDFQQKAVEQMRQEMNKLWQQEERTQMILHSPTGSGKTLMTCALIDSLQDENPEDVDRGDVAYFWITLNNELAMQSKDKFYKYFVPNLRNTLSTFDDCGDTLKSNEILFVNWQKLSQKRGKDRLLLRRPTDDNQHKESGFYFEDLMENTAKAGRRIVMIIDESHSNVGTDLSQEIIDYVNPKLILKVSATPFKDKTAEQAYKAECFDGKAAIVKVEEADVVAEGLIKEEIVCQTEEDLKRFEGGDIDNTMLSLAIQKRQQIALEWARAGKEINPLVLIQLPNDENEKIANGEETKEAFTRRILKQQYGIPENKIATWLADKEKKPEWRLEEDDSPIDYLIFKCAAGTGWDCPRAHILVMFREIQSPVFSTQTLGRIKRLPINGNELTDFPILRRGYLYTTYKTNEIVNNLGTQTPNKPKINKTQLDNSIKKKAIVTTLTTDVADIFLHNDDDEKTTSNDNPKIDVLVENIQKVWQEEISKPENVEGTSLILDFGEEMGDTPTQREEKEIAAQQKVKMIANKIKEVVSEQIKSDSSIVKALTTEQTKAIEEITQIAVETHIGKREAELIIDPTLKTQYVSRANYGDLGKSSDFQNSFFSSMHNYFGTKGQSTIHNNDKDCLESFGIELNVSPQWQIMKDKVWRFAGKNEEGSEFSVNISINDISLMFNNCCYDLLKQIRGGNVARSWSILSQALRQWFNQLSVSFIQNADTWRRIFVYDCQKDANSIFRKAIAKALEDYQPILNKFIKEREEDALRSGQPFKIKTTMAFDEEHEIFTPSDKSFQQPFYIRKEYKGRDNETSFIRFLEGDSDVEHWMKNADSGKDALGIAYYNTTEKENKTFNPDWIVLYANGDIGIYDTKAGITSVKQSQDTRDKLKALTERINWLNQNSKHHYRGGIYEVEGGTWNLITTFKE